VIIFFSKYNYNNHEGLSEFENHQIYYFSISVFQYGFIKRVSRKCVQWMLITNIKDRKQTHKFDKKNSSMNL